MHKFKAKRIARPSSVWPKHHAGTAKKCEGTLEWAAAPPGSRCSVPLSAASDSGHEGERKLKGGRESVGAEKRKSLRVTSEMAQCHLLGQPDAPETRPSRPIMTARQRPAACQWGAAFASVLAIARS